MKAAGEQKEVEGQGAPCACLGSFSTPSSSVRLSSVQSTSAFPALSQMLVNVFVADRS